MFNVQPPTPEFQPLGSKPEPCGAKKPFPKYLMDPEARGLIGELQARGLRVEVLNPACGSVEVVLTAPDGSTHCEIGRPEELAEALQRAAAACG